MSSFSKKLCVLLLSLFVATACNNTHKVINETANSPRAKFEGKVIDQETKEPISGAKVWVEGTTINSKTDKNGYFSLTIPHGYFEIHARAEGYKFDQARVAIEDKYAKVHDFFLSKKISKGSFSYSPRKNTTGFDSAFPPQIDRIKLLEAEIDSLKGVIADLEYQLFGNENKIEDQKVKVFINQYINDELNCSLTNPEVIEFAETEEGTLWINDPVELIVMNHELGYKLIIQLNEFVSQEYSEIIGLNVDADYFFEEMTPENEIQARRWEKNRNKYFNGSLRHFLIAMASDKSPLYFGYRLYSGQFVSSTSAMAYSSSSVTDVEKQKYELVFPNNLNGNNILKFGDELRIEYVEKDVVDPHDIMGLDMYQHQTSWLSLNANSVEFSDTGFFESPRAVEVKGVWRYTPVCKMVPGDYLPEVK